jgi:hypothetical protein
VALVEALAGRSGRAVDPQVVEVTLAEAGRLGEDQADAVRVLTGAGGSLRAALAPAGYGKTTMLSAAAQAAASEARPVIAVATTAKAVAELAGAGLDARTIARLRVDLADGPLAAGTVVVLDEISQTPPARSKPSWPPWTPARAAFCGCWATPASPNQSARAGSPTTSTGSAPASRSRQPG